MSGDPTHLFMDLVLGQLNSHVSKISELEDLVYNLSIKIERMTGDANFERHVVVAPNLTSPSSSRCLPRMFK